MNPIAAAQALLYCVAAFVLGLVLGAVATYPYAHAKGEATHLEAMGSLKGTVDSCNVAAAAANATAEADKLDGVAREERIAKALEDNAAIAAAASRQRAVILTKPIRGATDCEQLNNAVNDHFRGAKP